MIGNTHKQHILFTVARHEHRSLDVAIQYGFEPLAHDAPEFIAFVLAHNGPTSLEHLIPFLVTLELTHEEVRDEFHGSHIGRLEHVDTRAHNCQR